MNKFVNYLSQHRKPAFILVIAIIVGAILLTGPKSGEKNKEDKNSGKGVVSKEDSAAGSLSAVQKKLEDIEKRLDEDKKARDTKKLDDTVNHLPPIDPTQIGKNKLFPKKDPMPIFQIQSQYPASVAPSPPAPPPPPLPRLQKKQLTSLSPEQQVKPVVPKDVETKVFSIPASSYVEVKILSGVYAPASEALPVTAMVQQAFVGPNKSSVPLKGCQIIGKAKGDIGNEVANIQAVRLICVWPDGSTTDEKINGYFASREGVFGVPGEVQQQSGKFFSTVGITSFLESFTQGLSKAQELTQVASSPYGAATATNVTGDVTKYGLEKGAEAFAGSAKKFFSKQAESLIPSVLIKPGSIAYIFLLDTVKLKGAHFENTRPYFDSVNLSSVN